MFLVYLSKQKPAKKKGKITQSESNSCFFFITYCRHEYIMNDLLEHEKYSFHKAWAWASSLMKAVITMLFGLVLRLLLLMSHNRRLTTSPGSAHSDWQWQTKTVDHTFLRERLSQSLAFSHMNILQFIKQDSVPVWLAGRLECAGGWGMSGGFVGLAKLSLKYLLHDKLQLKQREEFESVWQ